MGQLINEISKATSDQNLIKKIENLMGERKINSQEAALI